MFPRLTLTRLRRLAVALSLAVVVPAGANVAHAEEVTVFAAASLKTAMDEIAPAFAAETGDRLVVSLAGSSALARQIQAGAPADLFISANTSWMDTLERDGLIRSDTRRDLLANSIVLVAHGKDAEKVTIGPDLDLAGLLAADPSGSGRLAMALVEAVPAGIYGKAALVSLGLWDSVSAKVAQADNVRAALALVATGEAPYGIVYATDASAEDDVSVVGTFPADSHPPIVYPAALTGSATSVAAERALDFLSGDTARAAFERQGFVILD
uniref:molybdate ABC transporter substrate-binding protein n=1 Tax=Stappia sp. TaxID=1870903 RepID=UPI003BAC0F3B